MGMILDLQVPIGPVPGRITPRAPAGQDAIAFRDIRMSDL
jgi:hypothetical protein